MRWLPVPVINRFDSLSRNWLTISIESCFDNLPVVGMTKFFLRWIQRVPIVKNTLFKVQYSGFTHALLLFNGSFLSLFQFSVSTVSESWRHRTVHWYVQFYVRLIVSQTNFNNWKQQKLTVYVITLLLDNSVDDPNNGWIRKLHINSFLLMYVNSPGQL